MRLIINCHIHLRQSSNYIVCLLARYVRIIYIRKGCLRKHDSLGESWQWIERQKFKKALDISDM